jgi:subtilisin family serine protease
MERRNPPGARAHEQLTGKGVGLAIIDQGLLVNHVEYRDRLRLYEEIHCLDQNAAMHGPAVASLAVGRTISVAPPTHHIAVSNRKEASAADCMRPAGWLDSLLCAPSADSSVSRRFPKTEDPGHLRLWLAQMPGYQEARAAWLSWRDGIFVPSPCWGLRLTYHAA